MYAYTYAQVRYQNGHKMLVQRAKKIVGVTVIGSFYLTTPLIKGELPVYEGDQEPLPVIKADDADEDEEGESEEYVMEQIRLRRERRAEFLAEMASGISFELQLYLPMRVDFEFCHQFIPAQSSYLIKYTQQDLALVTPDQDRYVGLVIKRVTH